MKYKNYELSSDIFMIVIIAVPVWALRLITYRASSLSLSINKLYWFWRSRQMDWPLLASSLVNPICPCGGKTTKKQKCIVSSVLLPFHIGYNRHYSYYRIREFEAHWENRIQSPLLFWRISMERRFLWKRESVRNFRIPLLKRGVGKANRSYGRLGEVECAGTVKETGGSAGKGSRIMIVPIKKVLVQMNEGLG